MKAIVSECHCR